MTPSEKPTSKSFDFNLAGNAMAIGFWLWLAYHQVMTAVHSLNPVPLLLGLESTVVGFFLLSRKPEANSPHPWYVRLFILSMALVAPLIIEVGEEPAELWVIVVSCLGLILTIWALITLGKSFGVSPADRGLVVGGPYRFLRHPMYAGALINMTAVVLANLSPLNAAVVVVTLIVDVYRILLEERTVAGYSEYAGRVRWRLIPWIW